MAADSSFDSVGGETPTVTAVAAAVVLNRTTFSNVQQRSAARDFSDPQLGGPLAGEHQADGLHVVSGRTASLVTLVRSPQPIAMPSISGC